MGRNFLRVLILLFSETLRMQTDIALVAYIGPDVREDQKTNLIVRGDQVFRAGLCSFGFGLIFYFPQIA